MRIKVAVLGATGMLGGMVCKTGGSHKTFGFTRKDINIESADDTYETLDNSYLLELKPDFIVNCIGAIKPQFKGDITEAVYTNAIFPREIASWVDMQNSWGELPSTKLIHITTDCVYDGLYGGYTESSPHNAIDDYGKSKSLGEPENCMVLRTSIIGPEWNGNKRSLVEWLISNSGGKVSGFTNHIWNGITTLELSKCIGQIIDKDLYSPGTHHIYSEDINKFDLLRLMNSRWELGIQIEPAHATQYCNRTLRTEKNLNSILSVATQTQMAIELKPYIQREENAQDYDSVRHQARLH